jgi:hypothetical protein
VSSYSSYESPPRRHPPSSSKTSRTGRFLSQAAGAATAAGSVFALMGMKKKHDDEIARGERQARERNNYYSESEPESVQPAKHTSRSNKLTRRPNPEDSSKGTTTYSYV